MLYLGPDRNVEAAAKFIQDQFQARNMNKDKLIYPHFTTATDTNNIQVVLACTILKSAICTVMSHVIKLTDVRTNIIN